MLKADSPAPVAPLENGGTFRRGFVKEVRCPGRAVGTQHFLFALWLLSGEALVLPYRPSMMPCFITGPKTMGLPTLSGTSRLSQINRPSLKVGLFQVFL